MPKADISEFQGNFRERPIATFQECGIIRLHQGFALVFVRSFHDLVEPIFKLKTSYLASLLQYFTPMLPTIRARP